MSNKHAWIGSLTAGFLIFPGVTSGCEEQDIPLSAVPQHVLAAAESALSGVQLVQAELVSSNNHLFYELEGLQNDTEYEIVISHDGELVRLERDDDH